MKKTFFLSVIHAVFSNTVMLANFAVLLIALGRSKLAGGIGFRSLFDCQRNFVGWGLRCRPQLRCAQLPAARGFASTDDILSTCCDFLNGRGRADDLWRFLSESSWPETDQVA